jgi:hypothetical protein
LIASAGLSEAQVVQLADFIEKAASRLSGGISQKTADAVSRPAVIAKGAK